MASRSESGPANPATRNDTIATYPCPDCYLCGQRGEALYSGLTDRLSGAPGRWNLKRCPAAECGLVWLDPMPREDEIAKAYATYYTHANVDVVLKTDPLRRLYRAAKSAYVHNYYGSDRINSSVWSRIAALPIRMVQSVRDELEIPLKYFARGRGRMLDVGCGDGSLVQMARDFVWEAEGIDVDARALENARSKRLTVRSGALADQGYPDSTFDLIMMR